MAIIIFRHFGNKKNYSYAENKIRIKKTITSESVNIRPRVQKDHPVYNPSVNNTFHNIQIPFIPSVVFA